MAKRRSIGAGNIRFREDKNLWVGEFLRWWFDEVARHNLRASTLISHESVKRRHILPTLGSVTLGHLTPAHIQSLYSQKLDEDLAKKTVKYIHTIIHQAQAQAVKWGLVARNVSEAVELPSGHTHKVDALSKAPVAQLLKALEGDRLYPFYVLLISTGLKKARR